MGNNSLSKDSHVCDPDAQGFGQGRIHNAPEEGCILPRLVMQGKNQGAEPHQKFAYPRITLSEPRFQIFTDLPGKRRLAPPVERAMAIFPCSTRAGTIKELSLGASVQLQRMPRSAQALATASLVCLLLWRQKPMRTPPHRTV